nr:MAG TPA: hypothetical protein [Caudoviricetes sp.]
MKKYLAILGYYTISPPGRNCASPIRAGTPHLAVIEPFGYVPTNQGRWTSVRAHLVSLEE